MKNAYKLIAPLFFLLELGLYIIVLFFPQVFPRADFTAIALACAFAFYSFKPIFPQLFLNAGLLATVCADVALVLLSPLTYEKQLVGVTFFSVTQLAYFFYLFYTENKTSVRRIHLYTRLAAIFFIELTACCVLQSRIDALSLLSVFYIANLATTVLFSYLRGKKELLFSIGLTLFLCCDLFVGFSIALESYLTISESSIFYKIIFSDFNFVWFFYLPSQAIIAFYTVQKRL